MRERVRESCSELRRAAAAGRSGRARGGAWPARVDARRPLHLPRLSRVRACTPRTARTCSRRVPGSGLGILREGEREAGLPQLRAAVAGGAAAGARADPAQPDESELAGDGPPARLSRLHRRQALRRATGRSPASAASSASTRTPPTARARGRSRCCAARLSASSSAADSSPGSHDHKALVEILETLPARRAVPDRRRTSCTRSRSASSTSASVAAFGSSSAATCSAASCRASSTCRSSGTTRGIRRRIEEILQEAFDGASVDFSDAASPSRCWRDSTSSSTQTPGAAARLRRRRDRSPARRGDARVVGRPPRRADRAARRGACRGSLPALRRRVPAGAYRDDFSTARRRSPDIERIERLDPDGDLDMSLYVPLESPAGHLAFKLLRSGQPILLSDVLPLLENMGVAGHRRAAVRGEAGRQRRRFGSTTSASTTARVSSSRPIECARASRTPSRAAWRGDARERRLQPARPGRRADVARGHAPACDREVPAPGGSTFSQTYMEEALVGQPGCRPPARRALPAPASTRRGAKARTSRSAGSSSEIEDRARRDREPRRGSDPARLPPRDPSDAADELLPDRRGRSAEAVPLVQARSRPASRTCPRRGRCSRSSSTRRGRRACTSAAGKVARGGIRWSDRREDFRTEVLGLMKAQTVKNAVIVPTGAKGGFVLKRPPAERDALRCRRSSSATGSSSAGCST